MKSPNVRYLPAVDHLRLLAALMVLTFHSVAIFHAATGPWPKPTRGPELLATEGYSGVALFMVLSGFILTYGALGRRISYLGFLRSRALRIMPLLVVVFLFSVLTTPSLALPRSALGVIVPTSTSIFGGYFGVAWSVVIELQLYLLFPVLLRQLEEGGPRRLLALFALTAGMRYAALGSGIDHMSVLYFSVFARADQFVVGMLVAWMVRRHGSRLWAVAAPAGMAGVVALLASISHGGGVWDTGASALGPRWAVMSPTVEGLAWGCVVLGYVSMMQGVSGPLSRGLAKLGATTYSVYMLHVVVLTVVAQNHVLLRIGTTPLEHALATAALVGIPLTLLAARLSYRMIELPFLAMRGRYLAAEPADQPVEFIPVRLAS